MSEKPEGKQKRQDRKTEEWCPFCEDELVRSQMPYCQPCKLTEFNCPECGRAVAREEDICPHCGFNIKKKASEKNSG